MTVHPQHGSRGGTWDSKGKTGSEVVLTVRGCEEGILYQAGTLISTGPSVREALMQREG